MIQYIKETLLYYLIEIYINSWLYKNVGYPGMRLKEDIGRCLDIQEANKTSNVNFYKHIPKIYKDKIIHEKFK